MFWALAGIVKALISGGIKIIKLALVTTRTGDTIGDQVLIQAGALRLGRVD